MHRLQVDQYQIEYTFRHNRDVNFEIRPGHVVSDVTSCPMWINGESFEGLAACSKEDTYDKAKGRKIALARSLYAAQVPRNVRTAVWKEYFSRGAK